MILPEKHIRLSESLFGLGGYVLRSLKKSKNLEEIWDEIQMLNNSSTLPTYHSHDNLILTINYLYMIGAINVNKDGLFYICN